jgi:RNA polymerase sigma-70 factor, ECF subfamily
MEGLDLQLGLDVPLVWSTKETAQILRIGKGCVKTRLARARLQMRNALTPGIDVSWMTGRVEFAKIGPFVE